MTPEANSSTGTLPPNLILDACSVINLFATQRMEEILRALPIACTVARHVAEREVLWVGRGRRDDPESDKERVTLGTLIEAGTVGLVDLETDAEADTFVELAARLEDGEAYSGAIAAHRGLTVVTDDEPARKVFTSRTPAIATIRTSDVLYRWSLEPDVKSEDIRRALRLIRERARFEPCGADPHRPWWTTLLV